MIIGVAIFVGGMIAAVLLAKYLGQQQTIRAQTAPQIVESPPVLTTQQPSFETLPQSPQGEVFTRTIPVTSQTYLLDDKQLGGLNWTSFDLTNNGPGPVYISVNNMDWPESALPVGQTINIDFKQRNAIKKIYLKCDAGNTAEVLFWVVK